MTTYSRVESLEDQLIVRRFVQSEERLKELFCEVDLVYHAFHNRGVRINSS